MHRYFIEWLAHSLGAPLRKLFNALLTYDVTFKPNLTYFLEVSIDSKEKGELLATPKKGNGSGDLANVAKADAIIELPRGKDLYQKGEVYPIYFYR